MLTLLIATRNAHKVGEIRAILPEKIRYFTLQDFPSAPQVIEDADSFSGNAAKKSVQLSEWLSKNLKAHPVLENTDLEKFFVLADDSGLEVDALNGAPGIYSARFAAMDSNVDGNSSDTANNEKLLRLLRAVPMEKRTGRFHCAISLTPVISGCSENSSPTCFASEAELRTEIFEGTCEGRIDVAMSRPSGFGYDPLFIPNGFSQSFSELGDAEKNKISHRARALEKLKLRFEN